MTTSCGSVWMTGNMEFFFGVVMFGNGAYTMFESGSKIQACMMCLHVYFNIYLQAKNGWKTIIKQRTAVKKMNSLPEVKSSQRAHPSATRSLPPLPASLPATITFMPPVCTNGVTSRTPAPRTIRGSTSRTPP